MKVVDVINGNDNSFYDGEWKGDKMHGRGNAALLRE